MAAPGQGVKYWLDQILLFFFPLRFFNQLELANLVNQIFLLPVVLNCMQSTAGSQNYNKAALRVFISGNTLYFSLLSI